MSLSFTFLGLLPIFWASEYIFWLGCEAWRCLSRLGDRCVVAPAEIFGRIRSVNVRRPDRQRRRFALRRRGELPRAVRPRRSPELRRRSGRRSSAARRVGKESVRAGGCRWSPSIEHKQTIEKK